MIGHEGHQSDLSSTLNGAAECTLVLGADAGPAAGFDLGPLRDEAPNLVDLFVVDVGDFLDTEGADLTAAHKPAARASTGAARPSGSTRSAWSAAGTATAATTAKSWWSSGSAWSSRGFCGHSSSSPLLSDCQV